jgi:hypothetical protein
MQSLNGVARPFSIWADWRDIHTRGVRCDVPEVPTVVQTPMPVPRFLYVGEAWDDSAGPGEWTGLRDSLQEAITADSPCAPKIVTTADGRAIWALSTDKHFDVDPEAAMNIFDYEMDTMLNMDDRSGAGQAVVAYRWYAQYGCLTLSHAQRAEHDEIARRTAVKERRGLTLDYDIERVRSTAVGFDGLRAEAQAHWGGSPKTKKKQR